MKETDTEEEMREAFRVCWGDTYETCLKNIHNSRLTTSN